MPRDSILKLVPKAAAGKDPAAVFAVIVVVTTITIIIYKNIEVKNANEN